MAILDEVAITDITETDSVRISFMGNAICEIGEEDGERKKLANAVYQVSIAPNGDIAFAANDNEGGNQWFLMYRIVGADLVQYGGAQAGHPIRVEPRGDTRIAFDDFSGEAPHYLFKNGLEGITGRNGFQRYRADGSYVDNEVGSNPEFNGLWAAGMFVRGFRLWVGDATNHVVFGVNKRSLARSGPSLPFLRPGHLAVDREGLSGATAWVQRRAEGAEPSALVKIDLATGAVLAVSTAYPAGVQALDIDPYGRLVVTDPVSRKWKYHDWATGAFLFTFGDDQFDYSAGVAASSVSAFVGGRKRSRAAFLSSGYVPPAAFFTSQVGAGSENPSAGRAETNRTDRPVGCGFTASGEKITVDVSGTYPQEITIRRFPPQGDRWVATPDARHSGGMFADAFTYASESEDGQVITLYSSHMKATFDRSETVVGREWKQTARLIDFTRFPTIPDANVNSLGFAGRSTKRVINVGGEQFLVCGESLEYFRFQPSRFGEVKVPCNAFFWRDPAINAALPGYPQGYAGAYPAMWTDGPGGPDGPVNGNMQAGEYAAIPGYFNQQVAGRRYCTQLGDGSHVLIPGDVNKTGCYMPCVGLTAHKALNFNVAGAQELPCPWAQEAAGVIEVAHSHVSDPDDGGDLCVFVRTATGPNNGWKLRYYPDWLSRRTETESPLPLWENNNVANGMRRDCQFDIPCFVPEKAGAVWIEGDYVFVVRGVHCEVSIYRRDNGAAVGHIVPRERFYGNTQDGYEGFSVKKLSDGTYMIVVMAFLSSANCVIFWTPG